VLEQLARAKIHLESGETDPPVVIRSRHGGGNCSSV
jgi:hypothetical protein